MTVSSEKDKSLVSALSPSQLYDLKFNSFKNAARTQGSFKLKLLRPSRSFVDSRQYVKGDPVKMIDWKAYARSDQLIIRQLREEASSKIDIVLDIGQTMCWPLQEMETDLTQKKEIASRVALNLAYSHLRNGDQVKVWLKLDGDIPTKLLKPRSPSDIQVLFDHLVKSKFSLEEFVHDFIDIDFSPGWSDVNYWVGDGLTGIPDFSGQTRSRGIFFHILSSLELDCDWLHATSCYFDESSDTKEYDGASLIGNSGFNAQVDEWRDSVSKECSKSGALYFLLTEQSTISNWQMILDEIGE